MPVLFLIVLIDLIGFGLVIPLLPFYAVRFSASPQQVTMLLAVYSLMQLFTAPLWGRLSDRVGRRPVLMASMAASALAYLWLGVADALWMLFAARALAGACAGNIAAAQAYIADTTTPENRAKGMGLIGAAFGLGFIFGPALGGFLAGNNPATANLAAPAWLAAGLSLVALGGVFFVLRESLPPELRGQAPRRSRLGAVTGGIAPPGAVAAAPDLLSGHPRLCRDGEHLCAVGDAAIRLGAGAGRLCLRLCRRAVGGAAGRADRPADPALRRGAPAARAGSR